MYPSQFWVPGTLRGQLAILYVTRGHLHLCPHQADKIPFCPRVVPGTRILKISPFGWCYADTFFELFVEVGGVGIAYFFADFASTIVGCFE